LKTVLRRILPWDFKPPENLSRRLLATTGYYRFRTWVGARGEHVPESHLYQPKFSPWEGLPEFEQYYSKIKNFTMVRRDSCYVLLKTLQQSLRLKGDVVECGVFRGGTALLEAMVLTGNDRNLHLFDSFEGMPKTSDGLDRFDQGDFSGTSADAVAALLRPYPFVWMHVGFIPDTFHGLKIDSISWAHIDVDLYQSVLDSIHYIYPRLVPGGFMVFDDYGYPSCPGARRAVDEAFAGLPDVPICLPTGQCLVVKTGVTRGTRRRRPLDLKNSEQRTPDKTTQQSQSSEHWQGMQN
jgi:O-methyltransferase